MTFSMTIIGDSNVYDVQLNVMKLKDEKKWFWEFQAKVDLVLAVYFTMCTRKMPVWQVDI